MATVQLANLDARLAYLALQYHLARPGSELDPETKQLAAHGLAEVARALEPQLARAVASVELSDHQRGRLVGAIAGAVNELKSYALLDAGGRTTVPAFHEALHRFFPTVREEPDEASQLAGHMIALRRKLERVAPDTASAVATRRAWWRFWERSA